MSLPLLLVVALQATPPSCAHDVTALKRWLAAAASDRDRGAFLAGEVQDLVTLPLAPPDPAPRYPAATLRVTDAGVAELNGTGAGAPVAPSLTRALLRQNRNLQFARTNPNAIARGVLLVATPDAPVSSVRAVAGAVAAEGERAWLVFRPADRSITRDGAPALLAELEATHGIEGVVAILRREFAACPALMDMMARLGGQTTATRLKTLIEAPAPAIESCRCRPPVASVQAILWHLAFRELATVVPLPETGLDALPWGDDAQDWADAAPALVAHLRARPRTGRGSPAAPAPAPDFEKVRAGLEAALAMPSSGRTEGVLENRVETAVLEERLGGAAPGKPRTPDRPASQVRLGGGTTGEGLAPGVVDAQLRRWMPHAQRCYRAVPHTADAALGAVQLAFMIEPDGLVSEVRVSGSELPDLHACLSTGLSALSFPPHRGDGPVRVTRSLQQPSK